MDNENDSWILSNYDYYDDELQIIVHTKNKYKNQY